MVGCYGTRIAGMRHDGDLLTQAIEPSTRVVSWDVLITMAALSYIIL